MNQTKLEIKELAQKMIDNQIDFIEGCRKIDRLSNYIDNSDVDNLNEHFLVFKGVFSESDCFPIGKVRNTCSPEHLAELDLDKEKFIAFYRSQVLDSCISIIQLI